MAASPPSWDGEGDGDGDAAASLVVGGWETRGSRTEAPFGLRLLDWMDRIVRAITCRVSEAILRMCMFDVVDVLALGGANVGVLRGIAEIDSSYPCCLVVANDRVHLLLEQLLLVQGTTARSAEAGGGARNVFSISVNL